MTGKHPLSDCQLSAVCLCVCRPQVVYSPFPDSYGNEVLFTFSMAELYLCTLSLEVFTFFKDVLCVLFLFFM